MRSRAGALVAALLVAAPAAAGPAGLRAGAAVVPIAVPAGTPLAGYGARGPGHRGLPGPRPVEARALVVEGPGGAPRVGIVALDVLIVTPDLRDAVRAGTSDLALDALVVAATHTHSGPGGYVRDRVAEAVSMGWYREESFRAVRGAATAALRRAERALAPAALGAATATAPGLASNRRRPGGPTDTRVPVLRVDGARGGAVATVFALAAHPTVLGPDDRVLSPDYPGAARDAVESRRGGVAIFLAGPLGDQQPGPAGAGLGDADAPAPVRAAALGEALGVRVADAAEHALPVGDAPVRVHHEVLALPPVDVRARCTGYVGAPLHHWLAERRFPEKARVTALRLGGLRLLASPFELGVEVAAALRERTPGPLLVTAHASSWLGYLLMPEDHARGGYETCLAFHGPRMGPRFVESARAALAGLEAAED